MWVTGMGRATDLIISIRNYDRRFLDKKHIIARARDPYLRRADLDDPGSRVVGKTYVQSPSVIVPDPCRNFLLLPKNIGGDIFNQFFNILYRNRI